MQNREFENKVQQKMDELKFTPSGAVWNKVEASLPKEKKRRWVIYLLLMLLITSSLVLWNRHGTGNKKMTAGTSVQKETDQQKNTKDEVIKKNIDTGTIISTTKTPVTVEADDNGYAATNKKKITTITSLKIKIKKGGTGLLDTVTGNDDAEAKDHKKRKAKGVVQINIKPAVPVSAVAEEQMAAAQGIDTTVVTERNGFIEPAIIMNDSMIAATKIPVTDSLVINKNDTAMVAVPKTKKQHARSTWRYGIELAAGTSNVKNNLFTSSPVYANSISGAIGSPGGGTPVSTSPNKPDGSIGLNAGFYAEKNISKNWVFKTGLNYLYQSNAIKVGDKIDSSINFSLNFNSNLTARSYYHAGNSVTYKNKFHLLEIPLIFRFQFPRSSRFYAEAGPSITYLLQSNALVYSTRSLAYVTDKDIFNKLGISLNGGAAINLAQRSALPFSIGYRFKYGMGSVVKTPFGKQHFINSFLFLKIPLKK